MSNRLIQKALVFARQRHAGQMRKDGKPFMTHPLGVARLLKQARQSEETVAAGILHDILEDTPTTPQELRRHFGGRVTHFVRELTEPDKKFSWEHRKSVHCVRLKKASREALAVSCADKIHNLRSLLNAYQGHGPAILRHFSRGIEKKTAQDRLVFETISEAWPRCPLLPLFRRELVQMERMAHKHLKKFPPKEREAKFIVRSPALFKELEKVQSLAALRRSGRQEEKQLNIYVDTPEGLLKKEKAALKLRIVGARAELTFKKQLRFHGDMAERLEVTVPLRTEQARLIQAGDLSVPALFTLEPIQCARTLIADQKVRELIRFKTDRTRLFFRKGTQRMEMDLDTVRWHKKVHREVELENHTVSGPLFQKVIMQFKSLTGKKAFPSRLSKFELGFQWLKEN